MSKKKKPETLTAKLPPGRKRHHGGYAFLTTGRLPEHRKYVEQYLTGAREQLVQDIGGGEQNLSAQEIILIDRVICKVGVLRCIEEHVKETGVFHGNRLNPALSKNYLSYSNSVRLDLQALGIGKRKADEILPPLAVYVAEKDAEQAKAQAGQGEGDRPAAEGKAAQVSPEGQASNGSDGQDGGTKAAKIEAPASTSSDIPGQADPGTREGQD
jgi:hypothetical protein